LSEGKLKVSVFKSNIAFPAENAEIKITDPTDGTVIEELKTGADGSAETVSLKAPPLEYSADNENERPFNEYNVSASLDGFKGIIIQNVQIYPETTALQNISLTEDFGRIVIPYPTLWGDFPPKIPEAEIKKLPFPTGQVVLPQPVVPSVIVVHAGVPDDKTAPDYTVSFKDYIKNVASGEIYSTWPKETLKANILAIISFTLNRVYTEWYRAKGYDFTITSSTAYDQSFTYGRNIYQEISDITDEVFTTYISKSDIIQPLFTQYCDGKRVIRDGWLSQWGSFDLGLGGFKAEQILKNYYGFDIIFKTAEKVVGIPLSFAGTLDIGSSGEAVKTVQRQLNKIADNYPLIGKNPEDGVYTPALAQSVKTFQKIFNLPQTGAVNFPTWYAISDVYTASAQLA